MHPEAKEVRYKKYIGLPQKKKKNKKYIGGQEDRIYLKILLFLIGKKKRGSSHTQMYHYFYHS